MAIKLGLGLHARVDRLAREMRVFSSLRDVRRYRNLRSGSASPATVAVRVKAIPWPMICRRGTTDAETLFITAHDQYHLPLRKLKENATILDLGANAGYTACHFATLYPTARIIAVEMDEGNARLAETNMTPCLARCDLLCAAVWTTDGTIEYSGDRADGFAVTDHSGPQVAEPKSARSITVASIIRDFGRAITESRGWLATE